MDSIAVLVNLLPELQRSIDVRIPVPVFVGTDPRTGRRFSGYRRASTLDDALIGFRRNEPDVVEIALAQLREQASG